MAAFSLPIPARWRRAGYLMREFQCPEDENVAPRQGRRSMPSKTRAAPLLSHAGSALPRHRGRSIPAWRSSRRRDRDERTPFSSPRAAEHACAMTGPQAAERRRKRELDWHRAELLRLHQWSRSAKLKYKPSKIMAVPPDMSFIPRPAVLLNSHVWRSLGIYELRFLTALEVEHCRHAGKENGYLVLTYDDAARAGVEREYFRRTLDTLVSLNLVELTHKGQYRQAARTDPNRYRLTYLKHKLTSVSGAPSYVQAQHDWIEIELAILDGRREPRTKPKQHRVAPRRRTAVVENASGHHQSEPLR